MARMLDLVRGVAVAFVCVSVSACGDDGGGFALGGFGTLEVAPPELEIVIDATLPGAASRHALRLTNSGTAPLEVRAARLVPGPASQYESAVVTVATALPLTLEVGASQDLELEYRRQDDRPRELVLELDSSDPLTPTATAAIDVVRGAGHLVLHPTRLGFARELGPTATHPPQTARLMNLGNAPLRVTRLRVDAGPEFSATLAGETARPGAASEIVFAVPPVITAGAELPLTVTFAPTGPERTSGRVIVFGDAPNALGGVVLDLVGNEDGPCLLVRPPSLDFGTKAPDDISEIPIQLENCGDAPVAIERLGLASDADAALPSFAALGVRAGSSPRFELVLDEAAPTTASPWMLAAGETRALALAYHAWSEADLVPQAAGEAAPAPGTYRRDDHADLVVASRSEVPLLVRGADAATELVVEPTVVDVPGCEWQGGEVRSHHVSITVTADNYYELWVNGALLQTDTGHWANEDTLEVDLDSGCHVIGIHAWGDGAVTAGLIAAVTIDGVVRWTTGDAKPEWSVTGPSAPAGDWGRLDYDDSAWSDPRACTNASQWGASVDPLIAVGARWVWWNPQCDDQLATAWFRLTFTVD